MKPETARHRSQLDVVARAARADVAPIVRTIDEGNVDAWWNRRGGDIVGVVAAGHEASAELAGTYLSTMATEAGVSLSPVIDPPNLSQIGESLRITGPVNFKQQIAQGRDPATARARMANRLRGAVDRLTIAGSRRTVMATVADAETIIGYRRIARAGACDFCQMLARRGVVYKSAESGGVVVGRRARARGNQRVGASYHDHCRCVVEPVFAAPAREIVLPDDQQARLQRDVDRAARRGRIEQARLDAAEAAAANRLEAARAVATGGPVDPAVLARYGVTEEQLLNARTIVDQLRRDIRETARRESDNLASWLDDRDLGQLSRPSRLRQTRDIVSGARRRVRDQAGYDWLEQLDDAELRQIRRRFVDSDLHAPDVVAEQVRNVTNLDLSDDEAMQWLAERWLHADGLRSIASGRLPRYADADALLPADYALEGYSLEQLFVASLDDAAGHVAQVQADAGAGYAARVLGRPTRGPAPWEMELGEYLRELESIEDALSTATLEAGTDPGAAYAFARERIRELAPADIDTDGDMNPLELYEAIRITAQQAGLI